MLLSISLYACIITSRPLDSRPGDPVACFSEHGGILPEPCSKCTALWPCSSHFQKRDGAVTHWKSHVGFPCGGHFVYRRGSARAAASPWLVDRPTLTPCSELILPLVPDLPGSAGPWPVSDSQGLDAVRGLLMCSADCSPGCCPSPPSCRPSVGSQKWGTRVRVHVHACCILISSYAAGWASSGTPSTLEDSFTPPGYVVSICQQLQLPFPPPCDTWGPPPPPHKLPRRRDSCLSVWVSPA